MSLLSRIKSFGGSVKAEGSAFVKIAELDLHEAEAKGRITSIDATNKVKNEVVSFIEKEADRVHTELAAVKTRFTNVLAKL
jgi:hypothetical protein